MGANATDQTAVLNRVRRAQGQLAGVLRMMEEGREVTAVINQLKAVSCALERAGFAMVASEWRTSLSEECEVSNDQIEHLEKLFLSLT